MIYISPQLYFLKRLTFNRTSLKVISHHCGSFLLLSSPTLLSEPFLLTLTPDWKNRQLSLYGWSRQPRTPWHDGRGRNTYQITLGHKGMCSFSWIAFMPNPKRVESNLIIPENIKDSEPCLRVHDEVKSFYRTPPSALALTENLSWSWVKISRAILKRKRKELPKDSNKHVR